MNPRSAPYSRFILLLTLLGAPFCTRAQTNIWDQPKNGVKTASEKLDKNKSTLKKWKAHLEQWGTDTSYTHAFYAGAKLNTNGWSGLLNYERKKPSGKIYFYQLSFSEIKHEKQIKQQKENTSFPELGKSTPFIFGKINNLYLLQIGYGKEQLLLPGVLEGNISLSFRYQAGFSLAMLKPYYLRLIHVEYTPDQIVSLNEEKYEPSNADLFLKKGNILGASKWSKGLDETSYVPGAFVEAAFAIQAAKTKALVQTILFGANASIHTQNLPIMAERKSHPWQASLFVSLMLGKRWKQ